MYLMTRKIIRYMELLRMEGMKTMTIVEQEEYLLLKSELLELDTVIRKKGEEVSQRNLRSVG